MAMEINNITRDILRNLNITVASEIDLEVITKAHDVKLKASDLDDSISGFFVIKNGIANIVYNRYQSLVRQRFTIAHELGHYILEHNKELSLSKTQLPIYRNEKSSTGEDKMEREANLFAATLLMPADFIEFEIDNDFLNQGNRIGYLAKKFKVSEQAMSYRLAYLDYDMNAIM
jgi:Zn-dependent peptidase ImmA (M78 family)